MRLTPRGLNCQPPITWWPSSFRRPCASGPCGYEHWSWCADRAQEVLTVTLALVAVDLDLTADVRIDFTTQITLDLVVTLKVITQRNQLLIRQILDANVRIDTGRGKRFLGTSTTNTKDVGEGDLDALLIGDVDSGKTCHCDSFCFPQVLHRVVRFPGPGLRTRGSSRFHGL